MLALYFRVRQKQLPWLLDPKRKIISRRVARRQFLAAGKLQGGYSDCFWGSCRAGRARIDLRAEGQSNVRGEAHSHKCTEGYQFLHTEH